MLRLRGNCIGDEGAAALSSAMAGSGLQELDVGHNQVRTPHINLSNPLLGTTPAAHNEACTVVEFLM